MRTICLVGLFVAAVSLASCVPQMSGTGSMDKTAQAHYQLGINHLNEGKTPQAIKELSAAQGISANNADIEHALGLAYQQKQLFDKAMEFYKKALELNPKLSEARNNFGTALLAAGKFDEALAQFNQCISDPLYATPEKAYYNIGVAYFSRNELDKAIEQYEKAVQIQEDNINALFNLGYCHELKKSYGKALDLYKKAVNLDPTFKEAYFRMGAVFHEQGNMGAALEILTQASEGDHPHLPAQFLMGKILVKTGKTETGLKKFEIVARSEPESELGKRAQEEILRVKEAHAPPPQQAKRVN